MTHFDFPAGFLWGTATAAHQVEGNNVNSDNWLMEHVPDTIFVEPSGDACDHYDRYAGDIGLLAELGFNLYRFSIEWARVEPDSTLPPEEGVELTQMGYEFWPESLEATIREAAAVAQVPVIVTENGIGTTDDTRRVEYIRRAVQGVAHCLRDGIDVQGYIYWSALDNFEWVQGYRPTFGLIAVDRSTQRRTAKPSAQLLGKIARANAIDWE